MTEQVWGQAPAPPKRGFHAHWKGRGGRREYWTAMGVMFAVGLAIGLFGGRVGVAMLAPSLLFMIRRLHDIGKTGWWALAISFGPIVPMLALLPFAPMTVLLPMVMLLSLVWTIWLGAIPGDPHENRWGLPPGAKALGAVFD